MGDDDDIEKLGMRMFETVIVIFLVALTVVTIIGLVVWILEG